MVGVIVDIMIGAKIEELRKKNERTTSLFILKQHLRGVTMLGYINHHAHEVFILHTLHPLPCRQHHPTILSAFL